MSGVGRGGALLFVEERGMRKNGGGVATGLGALGLGLVFLRPLTPVAAAWFRWS